MTNITHYKKYYIYTKIHKGDDGRDYMYRNTLTQAIKVGVEALLSLDFPEINYIRIGRLVKFGEKKPPYIQLIYRT